VQQLPYMSTVPFRVDFLLLPMALMFGVVSLGYCVLDALLLKSDNVIGLFRTAGITEWSAYLGIAFYKLNTTFFPFFILTIILGISLKLTIMGNAGRWLGTIVLLLLYAYATPPMGLILAKKYIKSDYKFASSWFPGVYMTVVTLPYIAWSMLLQLMPGKRRIIIIVGDVLCIIPQIAFHRCCRNNGAIEYLHGPKPNLGSNMGV